jgi:predicted ferric reductase
MRQPTMPLLRQGAIPVLLLAAACAPVVWALPVGLSPARSLGIVAGWSGCGLLLASLLLMLREPRLAECLGGLERMYHWHHRAGMAAYGLLLAHPLLLAADALPQRPRQAWQTLSPLDQGWPVWLGWLSLLLLMSGLAATFDRRIAYRAWRRLHLGLGLAVVIGLLHVLRLGIAQPTWLLLLLTALFLGWRVLRADFGLAGRPYVVQSTSPVADNIVEITLQPLAEPFSARPGQFVLVAFFNGPDFHGCGEYHPFTISAASPDGTLRLGVKALGDCTRRIQRITPGVIARVQGGFGCFLAEPSPAPQLWIAGGIGITPFLARLRAAPLTVPTQLFYFYKSAADAAFVQELQQLAANDRQLSLHPVATGSALPDLTAIGQPDSDLARRECYLCGPPGLVAGLRTWLGAHGITPRHIHCENFEFR